MSPVRPINHHHFVSILHDQKAKSTMERNNVKAQQRQSATTSKRNNVKAQQRQSATTSKRNNVKDSSVPQRTSSQMTLSSTEQLL
jgi:hypothetical protein